MLKSDGITEQQNQIHVDMVKLNFTESCFFIPGLWKKNGPISVRDTLNQGIGHL